MPDLPECPSLEHLRKQAKARKHERAISSSGNQIAADRARIAEMNALRNGLEPPTPDTMMDRFMTAAGYDADVFRGLIETVLCMALPQEVLKRPGIKDKIGELGQAPPMRIPGPDRDQLLRLLSA